VAVVSTKGNPYGHIILRGGSDGPNYEAKAVKEAAEACKAAGVSPRIVIDCSHANSNKDYRNQSQVWHSVWEQVRGGDKNIVGLMIESNINPGNQKIGGGFGELSYGVSVTDACIGWEETEELILSSLD